MIVFPLARLARLVALVALGAALMGLTGCVSMNDYNRVNNALSQAKQQLAEAENDINTLNKRIESLNAQIAQRDSMSDAYKALKAERDLLATQLADLQAKYKDLLANAGPSLPKPINDALQQLADQYPDLLEYDARLGMLRFKSDMTFDLGSTDVKPRAKEALKVFAGILNNPLIAKNEVRIGADNAPRTPFHGVPPKSQEPPFTWLRRQRPPRSGRKRGNARQWPAC